MHYLATGQVADSDPDWRRRVDGHRERRPPHWSTVETDDVAEQLRRSPNTPTLVDDIGGWLTAALDRHHAWEGGCISVDVDELSTAVDRVQRAAGAGQPRGRTDRGCRHRVGTAVHRRAGCPQSATGRAVRASGAGGRRTSAADQAARRHDNVRAGGATRHRRGGGRPGPAGHPHQAARRAGPAGRSVDLGVVMPRALPANAIRARQDRGLRRRPWRRPIRGVGLSPRGHRTDGRQHRGRRRGDQRTGRRRRGERAGRRPRGGRRAAVPADRRAQGTTKQRQHRGARMRSPSRKPATRSMPAARSPTRRSTPAPTC